LPFYQDVFGKDWQQRPQVRRQRECGCVGMSLLSITSQSAIIPSLLRPAHASLPLLYPPPAILHRNFAPSDSKPIDTTPSTCKSFKQPTAS
jgi:hypothetical protein